MDESYITEKLKTLKERLQKVLLFERVMRFVFLGSLLTAAILVIVKIFGYDAPLTYYGLIPMLLGILIPVALFFIQKISLMKVALVVDEKLQLKERLSTVLEWIEQNKKRTLMFKGLLRDAALNAQKISAEKLFPFAFPAKSRGLLLTLPVVCLLVLTPPWGTTTGVLTRQETKNIKAAVKALETSVEQLEKNPTLTPVVKKDLRRKTDELKKLVKNPNALDMKKTIARISDFKDRLKQERDSLSQQRSLLDKLGQRNDSRDSQKSGTGQGQQKSASEKMQEMAEQIKKKNLSAEEEKKITQELLQMREQLSANSELGKDLDKALASLSRGEKSQASEAMKEMGQKLRQMEQSCASDSDLEQMSQELDNLKNNLAGNSEMSPEESSDSSSEAQSGDKGAGSGQGDSEGKATEASAVTAERKYKDSKEKVQADFGVGTTNREQKGEGEGSPDYILKRQSAGESHWKELYDKLYKPTRNEMASAKTHVKGQLNGSQGATIHSTLKGGMVTPELNRSEPREVYDHYRGRAEEAITREKIPKEYKGLVKEYFKKIDPSR